jgi:hypothetical protein
VSEQWTIEWKWQKRHPKRWRHDQSPPKRRGTSNLIRVRRP